RTAGTLVVFRPLRATPWVEAELARRQAEREAADADAVIRGSEAAFVAALSPQEDRSGLDVSGDAALAALVLDALTPHSARDATVA
ncbi:MAG TPA: hypothetical protein VD931_19780, partial [Baekduia sp.]|nr:hypothetical protein [Baekduia sp.]